MQVLQFKTVHLAVIGAIASVFGMAAENINAEPLLTYEQNKVVDNVLSNADAGTQGFLYLNKKRRNLLRPERFIRYSVLRQ